MNERKGTIFFKAGAWILLVAGFGHAIAAIPDIFCSGLFSPGTDSALISLREVSLNIVEVSKGTGTSLLESAWAAYIGFAICVGLFLGFIGLILVLISRKSEVLDLTRTLIPVSIVISSIMTVISGIFFFYLPAILGLLSMICFILAAFNTRKGGYHAA
jgi:hypothetical protein